MNLFGPLDIRLRGRLLTDLKSREGERLLAYLIVHGAPAPAAAVADLLWPETASLDSLRHSVSHVRRILGPEADRLESARGTLTFHVDGADVDLVLFDQLIAQGDARSLRDAVALHGRPLLSGWTERWVAPHREARREQYVRAIDALAAAAEERRDYGAAARWGNRYLRNNIAEERAWRRQMRLLVLAHERTAALDLYHRYRDHLHEKYHIDPPAEMTALYHDIRENTQGAPSGAEGDTTPCEPVGGAVPPGSPMYVERPADVQLLSAIARHESIVLVKGPRQTGKSSLLARGLHQARRQGAVVLVTDFEQLTAADLESLESLSLRLAASLAAKMELDEPVQAAWKPLLGPGVNLERFLLKHVLDAVSAPVVWALDEVDRVFQRPYSGEFFSLLRSWHEKRSFEPARPWRRLSLALACATEAHLYIRDLNRSPFNVGTRLTLTDFDAQQVADLDGRHGGALRAAGQLDRFYELTGGHPYLVRRGLQEMATRGIGLEALVDLAARDEGPYGDHLRRMARLVAADPDLRGAVLRVLEGRPCDEESLFRLRSAGVLTGDSGAQARVRCRLYADYLQAHLPSI